MKRAHFLSVFLSSVLAIVVCLPGHAQTVTATLGGRVLDSSGGALPKVNVTAVNTSTGFSRSTVTSDAGEYLIPALPVGEYTVSVDLTGFKGEARKVTLQIGQVATVDFTLTVGEVAQKVIVEAGQQVIEPTRTTVSSVITQRQIENLPVNGRQFIDFTLLAPGVQIGDTTSGSTDVIVEPVTKLSFAGQNIHFNFIAVDGADDISTASGIQRATPSQEAVREFRVINSSYSTEFGRAVGGIVNIITRSGTNEVHGSVYEFFRNNQLDAQSILASPDRSTCKVPGDISSGGCRLLNTLRQNQFGGTLGGPVRKDQTFFFANYEGQRRGESPFYNSAVLKNIDAINVAKAGFGLPLEPASLNVLRTSNMDNFLIKLDHSLSKRHYLFTRYFFTDGRFTNQSPLNDGFDMPSTFKDNLFRDQSLVSSLSSTFSPRVVNELRSQFARRTFDFPTVTTQPHLEVANTFTLGVNRGNPDFYRESRFELVDNLTLIRDKHTISFGGNFNFVRTTESFPLFFPFEATFASVSDLLNGTPFVIFFERFQAPNFTETRLDPSIYQGRRIPSAVRNQAKGTLDHTYNGLFLQDKWRPTPKLTLNVGLRYEFETWPKEALDNDLNNVDPRFGFAYNVGTTRNLVVRGGAGIFHGIIPAPLLMCQRPSCGGTLGAFPGREQKEDALNAATRLFAYVPFFPAAANNALKGLLSGNYPDPTLASTLGLLPDAVIVRFARDHQAPYGIQMSLGFELEPLPDTIFSASYLRVKGVHLGSFFNVNQPDPDPTKRVVAHDSSGNTGLKQTYWVILDPTKPAGVPPNNIVPGTRSPQFGVYFEADSRWNSVFDGLLVNVNKRFSHHFAYGISYTFSKSIDDGPNPSFVLIPQDSQNIDRERAISADDVRHRFVANATLAGPTTGPYVFRDFQLGLIVTLQSPQHFAKFAGNDVNGDVFGVNDRVGIEPRNTFEGDSLQTVDVRVSRSFQVSEKLRAEFIAEAFNALNTVNVRFFNTVYGAADFCPVGGTGVCGRGPFFREGSPNPAYGTPRAIFNPRQIQFALRLSF